MAFEKYEKDQLQLFRLSLSIIEGHTVHIEQHIQLVIKNNVDVNCCFYGLDNEHGQLLLCNVASTRNRIAAVDYARLLIDTCGADINLKDDKGNTVLHYACLENHRPLIQLLFFKHADWTVRNNSGLLPIEMVWVRSQAPSNRHYSRQNILQTIDYVNNMIAHMMNRRREAFTWLLNRNDF
jgi:ankyrin repeat protein